jgi:hypothetical protein
VSCFVADAALLRSARPMSLKIVWRETGLVRHVGEADVLGAAPPSASLTRHTAGSQARDRGSARR